MKSEFGSAKSVTRKDLFPHELLSGVGLEFKMSRVAFPQLSDHIITSQIEC